MATIDSPSPGTVYTIETNLRQAITALENIMAASRYTSGMYCAAETALGDLEEAKQYLQWTNHEGDF